MDLRGLDVQSLAEVLSCIEEVQFLGLGPEFQLIAKAMTAVAVVSIGGDVDHKRTRVLAALHGAETAQAVSVAADGLKAKQPEDFENGDAGTKGGEVDSRHGGHSAVVALSLGRFL